MRILRTQFPPETDATKSPGELCQQGGCSKGQVRHVHILWQVHAAREHGVPREIAHRPPTARLRGVRENFHRQAIVEVAHVHAHGREIV